ncbi:PIG-L family deacetylase [Candidatus Bathyarchaeota archaeon]|nr:PIG-L family deacetylase [Candidatus Bathyarchaeota archaeon]MBS7631038.1 PIG-L family deacetylase [Candidatus Bathyarchaeota archaeon]
MEKKSILIVAAHPDDETFGCGGAILLHTGEGHKCSILALTCSNDERREEFKKAMNLLRANELVVLNHKKIFFNHGLVDQVSDFIVKVKPDIVVTHIPWDYHREHRLTYRVVKEALEWSAHSTKYRDPWNPTRLLLMEVNTLIPSPQIILDVSNVFEKKMEVIYCYSSQLKKFPDDYYVKFSRVKAELRGVQGGCKYGEAFYEETLTKNSPFFSVKSSKNLFN